jgi:hypothetical protein
MSYPNLFATANRKRPVLFLLFIFHFFVSYSQTKTITIDYSSYSAAGLTSVCNVFSSPTQVSVLENGVPGYTLTHTSVLGTTRYISSTGSIDLPCFNAGPLYTGGTVYAISYPFQNGYTYSISVTASANASSSELIDVTGLITKTLPGTSTATTCVAAYYPPSFTPLLSAQYFRANTTVATYTFNTQTIAGDGYNYFNLLSGMEQFIADIKSISIYKVQIIETAPSNLTCSLPAPTGVMATTNTDNSTAFSWNAVSGAWQYKINIADVHNGSTSIQTLYSNTNSLQYCAAGGGDNVTFYVQAVCVNDMSGTASAPYSFIIPYPSAPTGLSYNFPNCNRLEWIPVTGASAYNLQIQDLTTNSAVTAINGLTTYGLSVETDLHLISGHNYRAAINAVGGNGCNYQTAFSNWYSFTVSSPFLTIPTGISYDGVNNKLSWNTVSGATNYYIQYQDLTTGSSVSTFNMYGTNSVPGSNLSLISGHHYQASINASNNGCVSQTPYSGWYAFTAGLTPPPPPPSCNPPTIMTEQNLGGGHLEVLFLAPSTGTTPINYNLRLDQSSTSTMYNNVGTSSPLVVTVPNRGAAYTVYMQSVCPSNTSSFVTWSGGGTIIVTGTSPKAASEVTAGESNQINSSGDDQSGFKIYPVPSSGIINISFTAKENGKGEIIIINALGMPVIRKTIGTIAGTNSYSLNAIQLPNGVYSLKITTGNTIRVQKLIIQK